MGSQIGPRLLFFFPLGNAFSLESEENFFFFFPSLQSLFKSLCRKQILAGSLEPLMSAELLPTKGSCRISHWMVTSLQQQEIQVGLKVGPCSGSTIPYHVVPMRFPQPISISLYALYKKHFTCCYQEKPWQP